MIAWFTLRGPNVRFPDRGQLVEELTGFRQPFHLPQQVGQSPCRQQAFGVVGSPLPGVDLERFAQEHLGLPVPVQEDQDHAELHDVPRDMARVRGASRDLEVAVRLLQALRGLAALDQGSTLWMTPIPPRAISPSRRKRRALGRGLANVCRRCRSAPVAGEIGRAHV